MPNPKYILGIFPLSADPAHFGHLWIIQEAAKLCRHLIVLILDNDEKRGNYLLSVDTRKRLMETGIAAHLDGVQNVTVEVTYKILADFYMENGADALFRGIRGKKDVDYEDTQMWYHRQINPAINVEYVNTHVDYERVSSTMIKGFVSHCLDVQKYTPLAVKAACEQEILGQRLVGVVGRMCSGKSTVAATVASLLSNDTYWQERRVRPIPGHHLDMDVIVRQFYTEDTPGAEATREKVAELLSVPLHDGKLNSKEVKAAIAAADRDTREAVDHIVYPHTERLIRQWRKGKTGIIFFEWALLAASESSGMVNNDVILVTCSDEDHQVFLGQREAESWWASMKNHQPTNERTRMMLNRVIQKDGCGTLLEVETSQTTDFHAIATQVRETYPVWTGS